MTRFVLALALAIAAPLGSAQEYPAREIRSICNFAPGSGADIIVSNSGQIAAELFKVSTGLNTVYVPFKVAGDAFTNLRWGGFVKLAKIQPQ